MPGLFWDVDLEGDLSGGPFMYPERRVQSGRGWMGAKRPSQPALQRCWNMCLPATVGSCPLTGNCPPGARVPPRLSPHERHDQEQKDQGSKAVVTDQPELVLPP